MKRIYIAHINEETGEVQTIKEHSEGTAKLCEDFAVKEMEAPVSTAARLHDVGKYGERFQHKIRGDSSIRVEHSGSGAVEATKLFKGPMGWMMAYCIAGHHAGLPDGGLKTDEEDEATLHGRLKRDFDEYRQYEDDIEIPETDENAFAAFLAKDCDNDIKKLIDKFAFLTRYCFSCLTDADSIDTGRFCGSLTERELRADFEECLKRIDVKLSSFKYETELQRARKTVQEQVYQKTDLPGEVYLVNMPTGSGKTLCSLKFALEKAVKEEVKSQRMKTELISNVSHDLKTPLTSIITYVDLLKNNNLSSDDRQHYLDILERNSLRLKNLIEDLFEVSKANSGDVKLNLVDIDIISLIKQSQLECQDNLDEKSLSMKWNSSEEKIICHLDSSKTYRIFENLFMNISKYALPHTRVYIDIHDHDEMTFNENEIVERFVQGDKSRNTHGSGLGLAIVKSFTEIQGGQFHVELDGDLFKTIVIFPKCS